MYDLTTADVVPYIDPLTLIEAPHAKLAALRAAAPVVQLGEHHYMVLRAEDAFSMMTDPRVRQIEGSDYVSMMGIPDGAAARLAADFFLFSNGKEHKDKRGLFARTFSFGKMRSARQRIRASADAIVADLPRGQAFDFVDMMAARVPAEMIAAILGLPSNDADFFRPRVYDLARIVEPIYPHHRHDRIEAAATELFAYVEAALRARFSEPRDDLLTSLVYDWWQQKGMNFDGLVHQILGLIIGGTDTTRAAFAMLVSLLLQHSDQWDAVKADPGLIPSAVDEAIRFEPSVGSVGRFTVAPIEIDGIRVPAGAILRISTLSAMRDPAIYAEPDRFNIRRSDHPRFHPAFGMGPHRCLGEMLAKIEMQEALSALICAAPGIKLEIRPEMVGFGGIRQITPMIARIDA